MAMAFMSGLSMIMMLMVGSGTGDLLSFLPTDAYWAEQGVEEVSVETMTPYLTIEDAPDETPDIALLIDQLGAPDFQDRAAAEKKILAHGASVRPQLEEATDSPDPQIADAAQRLLGELKTEAVAKEVRRLMAIRALGELGKADVVDDMQPLTDSDAPFVANYAQRAIAALEGAEYTPPTVSREQLTHDLMALPGEMTVVGQHRNHPTEVTLDELIEKMPAGPMMMGEPEQIKKRMLTGMIDIAHEVGNVRLDAVTLGMVGDPDQGGHVVLLFRGAYDPEAFRAMLQRQGFDRQTLADKPVYRETGVAFVPLDGSRLLMLAGERGDALPIEATIAAAESGEGGLAEDEAMMARLKAIDRENATTWLSAEVFSNMNMVPVLNRFQTVNLTTQLKGEGEQRMVTARVEGHAAAADAAAGAVEELEGLIQLGLNEIRAKMENQPEMEPMMKPYLTMMENIELSSEGKTATLQTRMPAMNPMQMMMPMMGFFLMGM